MGIRITKGFSSAVLIGNYFSNSPISLSFDCGLYNQCVVKNNVFLGDIENAGNFETLFNNYNEVLPTYTKYKSIPYSEFVKQKKLDDQGKVATAEKSMCSNFIDISDIPANQFFLSFSQDIDAYRLVQYSSANGTDNSVIFPDTSDKKILMKNPRPEGKKLCHHIVPVTKLNGAKYIRIFIPYNYCPISNDFRMSVFC